MKAAGKILKYFAVITWRLAGYVVDYIVDAPSSALGVSIMRS